MSAHASRYGSAGLRCIRKSLEQVKVCIDSKMYILPNHAYLQLRAKLNCKDAGQPDQVEVFLRAPLVAT